MKKVISFLYLTLIINLAALGQQDPHYTNNMFFKLGINPGFAGAEDAINGLILNRYQWVGFPGAPKTLVFSADAAINAFGAPGGVGLNIISDQLGNYDDIAIHASYAYRADLGFARLGIGLELGLFNRTVTPDWYIPDDPIYTPPGSDQAIPQNESSQLAGDVGLGLFLSSNQYYLGLSSTHINQPEIRYSDLAVEYLARHYYLTGGYNITMSDPLFELRPSFLFGTDRAGWQMNVNTNLVYDERIWGGVSYRINDAVALLMGLELFNGLNVGYSFDLVTSSIARYGWGSHEVFVSYSVDLERNRNQKYKSVRFL